MGGNNQVLQFLRSLPGAEALEADLARRRSSIETVRFICYDVTMLRKINHAYGRQAGDALLASISRWVTGFPGGELYRVESDLFCVVYWNADLNYVYHCASSMEARFNEAWPLEIEGNIIDVFAQAAIAVLDEVDPVQERELPDLFERALEVSRKSRQVTLFDAEYDRLTQEYVKLQMELKSCVLSGMKGFEVYFQPIADPATGLWRGLEALARWTGPTIGQVPPAIFITEAEEMGIIHRIGGWMMDSALATCCQLGLDKMPGFFLSVNISSMEVAKRGFVRQVTDALDRHSFPANKLVMEVTESTEFNFTDSNLSAIEMLRTKGVRLALDDFGTGYSGFSNLKRLPVDVLKTDRNFIENIENDDYLQYFYYIMAETAHANGMTMVAEGVEDPAQLSSVVKNGADLVQGYLLGRPMSRQTLEAQMKYFTKPLNVFLGWKNSNADFKQWINGQDAYRITPSLFRLQSKCLGIVLDEEDLDNAVNRILGMVGGYFKVNHASVFLRNEGAVFSNRYEWSAEGKENQIELFQKIDMEQDGVFQMLRSNEIVIANNAGQLPPDLSKRLAKASLEDAIKSIVVMPMTQRGEILGFVSFDDDVDRDWVPEELLILHNLCLLCLLVLARDAGKRNNGEPG